MQNEGHDCILQYKELPPCFDGHAARYNCYCTGSVDRVSLQIRCMIVLHVCGAKCEEKIVSHVPGAKCEGKIVSLVPGAKCKGKIVLHVRRKDRIARSWCKVRRKDPIARSWCKVRRKDCIARSWRKVRSFPIETLTKIVSCVCVCFVCCARERNSTITTRIG
jgi:hypothetical protein